jgi:hypothetical protein
VEHAPPDEPVDVRLRDAAELLHDRIHRRAELAPHDLVRLDVHVALHLGVVVVARLRGARARAGAPRGEKGTGARSRDRSSVRPTVRVVTNGAAVRRSPRSRVNAALAMLAVRVRGECAGKRTSVRGKESLIQQNQ